MEEDEMSTLDNESTEESQSYIPGPLKACYQNPAYCAASVLTTLAVVRGVYLGHQSLTSPSGTLASDVHSASAAKSTTKTLDDIFADVLVKKDGGVNFTRSCSSACCQNVAAEKSAATAEAVHKVRSCPNFEPSYHHLSQTASHQSIDSVSSYDGQLEYLLGDVN